MLRRTMAELAQELDPGVFCRIHRSTIVNLDRTRGLELNQAGDYDVLLDNGTKLRLSRRYRAQLESRLGTTRGWR
jgi:two-component system, LytTR family, response regulator